MRGVVILAAGVALLSWYSSAVRAQAPDLMPKGSVKPSFDCATAKTGAARLICADADLARLDRELAFQKRRLQLSATDQSKFVAEQLAWIRDRNERCGLIGKNDAAIEVLASSKSCIVSAMQERIAVLAQTEATATSARPQQEQPTEGKQSVGQPLNLTTAAGVGNPPSSPTPSPSIPNAPTSASAQSGTSSSGTSQDWSDCVSHDSGRQIRGCTRVINDGRESQENHAIAFNNRGNAYNSKMDYERAIEDFTQAIQLNPKLAYAYLNRAFPLFQRGATDRSIADLNEAIRLDPTRAIAFYNRGIAYQAVGNTNGAIADFTQAIRLDPSDPRAKRALTQALSTQPTTGENPLANLSVQLKEVMAGVPPSSDPLVAWCTEHSPPPVNASRVANCVTDWRRHNDEVEAAKLAQQEAAKTAQQQYDANVARAKQQGYQSISFDDFKLDGKQLAVAHAKVLMQGFYKKFGEIESLQPTGLAVAMAREYGNHNGIPLLTDDASRDVRKIFLQCGDNPLAPLGCPLAVVGHASVCTMTSLVGSKSVPCLVVEDGW
jgi:tetratricopeptide (TPR) repeat protein